MRAFFVSVAGEVENFLGELGKFINFGGMNEKKKEKSSRAGLWRRVWDLYRDGFRNMTVGRQLWALIILKVVILFCIIKVLFFPDILQRDYDSDADRAQAVRESLTRPDP